MVKPVVLPADLFDARAGVADEIDVQGVYGPAALARLGALRRWFLDRERSGTLDGEDRWLRMVATDRLTGSSPGRGVTNNAKGTNTNRMVLPCKEPRLGGT